MNYGLATRSVLLKNKKQNKRGPKQQLNTLCPVVLRVPKNLNCTILKEEVDLSKGIGGSERERAEQAALALWLSEEDRV